MDITDIEIGSRWRYKESHYSYPSTKDKIAIVFSSHDNILTYFIIDKNNGGCSSCLEATKNMFLSGLEPDINPKILYLDSKIKRIKDFL